MPIVNYIREHRRFIQYASDEKLTANERLLWYALMEIMNQRADGCVWPDDFIRVGNDRVLTLCPMGFDTMAKARNGLKQRGLIEFRAGDKNKTNPAYKMNYFCPEDYPENSDKAPFYPKNSDNIQDNMSGNAEDNNGGNKGDNQRGRTGDQNQTKTENNIYTKRDPDEEEEHEKQLLRVRARAEAAAAWKENLGEAANPAVLNRIGHAQAENWQFDRGVIAYAVELAAMNGGGNPSGYVFRTLDDWRRHKVFTREDAEEYAFLFRASNGGAEGVLFPTEAMERIREFEQERESPAERNRREKREAGEEKRRETGWNAREKNAEAMA